MEKEKEEEHSPTLADKLKALLQKFTNKPSAEEIESLKARHGDIFLSALSDDEVFLFRALTRSEHRNLNSLAAEEKINPDDLDSLTVDQCVLWKSVTNIESKAGTIPSLYEQIMQNSNFLPPQVLTNLVTKL